MNIWANPSDMSKTQFLFKTMVTTVDSYMVLASQYALIIVSS